MLGKAQGIASYPNHAPAPITNLKGPPTTPSPLSFTYSNLFPPPPSPFSLSLNLLTPSPSGSVPIYRPSSSLAQYRKYSPLVISTILNSSSFCFFFSPLKRFINLEDDDEDRRCCCCGCSLASFVGFSEAEGDGATSSALMGMGIRSTESSVNCCGRNWGAWCVKAEGRLPRAEGL